MSPRVAPCLTIEEVLTRIRCRLVHRRHLLPMLSFLVVLVVCFPRIVGTVREVDAASLPGLMVDSIWLEMSASPGLWLEASI
jgi:hypothetical protein